MKAVVYSDTQFHPWQENEDPTRWHKLVDVIRRVYRLAGKHKCEKVIFLGDLFESKIRIRSDVVSRTFEEILRRHAEAGVESVFVAGNHDWYGASERGGGTCILAPFAHVPGCTVVSDVPQDLGGGLHAVPWRASNSFEGAHEASVLLLHADIRGAKFSARSENRKEATSGIDESILRRKSLRLVLNGHYHLPQKIKVGRGCVGVDVVGSPYQINWTDADSADRRGCCILHYGDGNGTGADGSTPSIRRIAFNYPRFWNTENEEAQEGDFIRDLSQVLDAGKVRTVKHDNYDIIGGADIEAAIRQYVEDRAAPQHVERLIQLGLEMYRGGGKTRHGRRPS